MGHVFIAVDGVNHAMDMGRCMVNSKIGANGEFGNGASDHFKDGAIPKSLMSRGNFS